VDTPPPIAPLAAPAARRRPLKRALAIIFRVAVLCYVGWCVALYFVQNRILFPAGLTHANLTARLPPDVEQLWLDAAPGVRIEAWLVKPSSPSPDGRLPLVIFFHGNAETIDDSIGHAELYTKLGFAVLLPEYRGYGRSGGSPSQSAIAEDMLRFRDFLAARSDLDSDRILYHGRSLGGGVACELARTRPPAALVLESTFASVSGFCWGFGIPPFLCSNPFRSDDVVRTLDVPVLILHGTQDDIIPVANGHALRDLARRGTYVEMSGHHNDFPTDWRLYERSVAAFAAPWAPALSAKAGAPRLPSR
jgi:pimeloyl-ACP methyl ester carboxylesterase